MTDQFNSIEVRATFVYKGTTIEIHRSSTNLNEGSDCLNEVVQHVQAILGDKQVEADIVTAVEVAAMPQTTAPVPSGTEEGIMKTYDPSATVANAPIVPPSVPVTPVGVQPQTEVPAPLAPTAPADLGAPQSVPAPVSVTSPPMAAAPIPVVVAPAPILPEAPPPIATPTFNSVDVVRSTPNEQQWENACVSLSASVAQDKVHQIVSQFGATSIRAVASDKLPELHAALQA